MPSSCAITRYRSPPGSSLRLLLLLLLLLRLALVPLPLVVFLPRLLSRDVANWCRGMLAELVPPTGIRNRHATCGIVRVLLRA